MSGRGRGKKADKLKASRLQEADVLLKRLRDAGMFVVPSPKRRRQRPKGRRPRVQILIDGDRVTVIAHGGLGRRPRMGFGEGNRAYGEYGYGGYGYGYGGYGYGEYGAYGEYGYGGYGYGEYGYGEYGEQEGIVRGSGAIAGDVVTVQIEPGGRVSVSVGRKGERTARRAVQRFQGEGAGRGKRSRSKR